jgi:hypothetical protein
VLCGLWGAVDDPRLVLLGEPAKGPESRLGSIAFGAALGFMVVRAEALKVLPTMVIAGLNMIDVGGRQVAAHTVLDPLAAVAAVLQDYLAQPRPIDREPALPGGPPPGVPTQVP